VAVPTQLVRQIERLDPMPISARRLMQALQDEDIGAAEIASYVECDPAMAADVLRTANSAAYGGMALVNLRAAVLRLGTATILNIVLGGTMRRLRIDVPMYGLGENELWIHSVAASLAVRALQQERHALAVPDTASVAALLHDIGKLVLARYLRADATAILEIAVDRHIPFVEAERSLLGCDHSEVGGALARHWGMPADIVDAVERHHQVPLVDPTPVMDAVVLGNLVAKCVAAGLGAEGMNLHVDAGTFQRLGLNFAGYSRIILQTANWLDELKQSYRAAA
jgi:putative nucleotidyltransferase with HDIG domain